MHGEDDEDKNILLSVYSSQHPQGLVSVMIPTLKVEKVRPGDSKPFVQDAGSIISRREGVNRANATQGLSSQRQHRTAWDNRDGKIHKPQPGSQNPAPSRRRTQTQSISQEEYSESQIKLLGERPLWMVMYGWEQGAGRSALHICTS